MSRTFAEINEKIRRGDVVVATAEEVVRRVEAEGISEAAAAVDVVTTGTFGPMCSSGVFLNFNHPQPRIKMNRVYLNGIRAYAGLAAVDVYLGVTEIADTDTANLKFPGEFNYGGGHVIEDLVSGREVQLEAYGYGTDCYPRREYRAGITLGDIREAFLFNPRNAYQNYNVGVNLSDSTLYTYMGILKPRLGNANYSSAGQLSPLMNDPGYRTIGIGTRAFFGGGVGYVSWHGTQHHPGAARNEKGVPRMPAGTLSLIGDLKQMSSRWLRGLSFLGYGATLQVGIGIPIPILDESVMERVAVSDEDIYAPVVDYSDAYPNRKPEVLGEVSYAQLKSGTIRLQGQEVPTAPLSSYPMAREIAITLKSWIHEGKFFLAEPVAPLPGGELASERE